MCFFGKICKLISVVIIVLVLVTIVFGFGWMKKVSHTCIQGHTMHGSCKNGSSIAPSPVWSPSYAPLYQSATASDNDTSFAVSSPWCCPVNTNWSDVYVPRSKGSQQWPTSTNSDMKSSRANFVLSSLRADSATNTERHNYLDETKWKGLIFYGQPHFRGCFCCWLHFEETIVNLALLVEMSLKELIYAGWGATGNLSFLAVNIEGRFFPGWRTSLSAGPETQTARYIPAEIPEIFLRLNRTSQVGPWRRIICQLHSAGRRIGTVRWCVEELVQ